MNDRPLTGVGVLITRPAHQSRDLQNAIEAAGGRAILFPVIDIIARSAADIEQDLKTLPTADIVIFVSANAVRYGLRQTQNRNTQVAAIGPATTQALEAAGIHVDIAPENGFDSKHLLAMAALTKVNGLTIRIVRGSSGRELLANTLRERGASVDYLSVYDRKTCAPTAGDLDILQDSWRDGRIDAVMVMSVASLESLLEILPAHCLERLRKTRLVAPGTRVIQTALERVPGLTGFLSPGPGAFDMTNTLIASLQPDADTNNG